ncbi:MAG: hypothetical protein KIT02_06295 [Devosia sp.]|uniref:hypothetical protein n=1 Tax=Devosia sp. TaxID=1871048 RepID=UPI0024CDE1B1|nr:hypothetical protein [Devosia sp.]UYO00813.1 MAG: hypothetical protein KIT02_06295 [Devosia sp.]
MKKLIALSVVAALAMAPAAQAGGFFNTSKGGLLGNVTSVLGIKDINVLNGTTVAVGNNSSILSNIGSGNGILGLGGQNTNINSNNSETNYWNSFNKRTKGRW